MADKPRRVTLKDVKRVMVEFIEYKAEWADNPTWTLEDYGLYFLLETWLYCHGGKIPCDIEELAAIARKDVIEFETTWQKVEKKFNRRNGVLTHKSVTKALKTARALMQTSVNKGFSGSQVRWPDRSSANSPAIAGGIATKLNLNNNILSTKKEIPRSIKLRFVSDLQDILPPKDNNEKKADHNLVNALHQSIVEGRLTPQIYERVIDIAKESLTGEKPRAVFYSQLHKDGFYTSKAKAKLRK